MLCFGDIAGGPQLLKHLSGENITALVAADIRPQYHAALADLAARYATTLLIQPRKTSSGYPEFLQRIKQLAPDLILVNSYSMLLHQELLDIPGLGAINIHGALLPQYRGCNPTQWSIVNREVETGVTMHYMDAGFDTGDIIAQKHVPILFEDTWRDVQQKIASATEIMLTEQIPKILSGTNGRVAQQDKKAHYWRRRTPEDGRFEWTWRAVDIYNLIRALVKPHPGAYYLDIDCSKTVIDYFVTYEQVKQMQVEKIGRILD